MFQTLYIVTWCLITYSSIPKKDDFNRIIPSQFVEQATRHEQIGYFINEKEAISFYRVAYELQKIKLSGIGCLNYSEENYPYGLDTTDYPIKHFTPKYSNLEYFRNIKEVDSLIDYSFSK